MVFGYEYANWARFGLSSRVYFADERGRELNYTLILLDSEQAVLRASTDRLDWTREFKTPPVVTIPANPSQWKPPVANPMAKELREWIQLHAPQLFEKLKELADIYSPILPQHPPIAEGKGVIEISGEERLCRWVERRYRNSAREYRMKAWYADDVPGGIVACETWEASEAAPTRWTVRSFEAH